MLYMLLIVHADAYGREAATAVGVKMRCLPGRSCTVKDVEKALQELHSAALIIRYEVEEKLLYQVTQWDRFQCFNSKNRAYKSKFPMHSFKQCPARVRDSDSDSEGEREGEVKRDGEKKKNLLSEIPAEFIGRAELLRDLMIENLPNTLISEKQLIDWAGVVRLMVEKDERTLEEIDFVLRWCQADDFWKNNIRSMQTFRKQYEKLSLKRLTSLKRANTPLTAGQKTAEAGRAWLEGKNNASQ